MSLAVRVVGVPEHFNLPWKLALEENLFSKDTSVHWKDEPSGTGAMCESLRNGQTDLAVILTEGIVADIDRENPSRIIDIFVQSPLVWGIHTSADRKEDSISDFKNPIYAISRKGSGSHWMAILEGQSRGQSSTDESWNVVGNIANAIESLERKESDLFFWEKFMTAPYVEKGLVKRIGEFPTPWPCFVVAVRNEFWRNHSDAVKTVLSVVKERARTLQNDPNLAQLVHERYGISLVDAKSWSQSVRWNTETTSPIQLEELLNHVRQKLAR